MRQTSLEAFWAIKPAHLSNRQQQVLETLRRLGSACNRQISAQSGLPINVVTPRCNELVRKGLIEQDHIKMDITGRRAIFWKVKE